MYKKVLLFIMIYLVALTTLFLVNDDTEMNTLYNKTLYDSASIDTNEVVEIEAMFRNGNSYSLSDEEMNTYMIGKIRVVESLHLTNTIEVYTMDIYEEITENVRIEITGNSVSITSDLGPLSFYKGSTFLPFAQFDSNYFASAPNRIYEIHIPKDTQYTLD